MIDLALLKRKQKMEESQNLLVTMKPEFVSALSSAINFSSKPFFG
jgi:hypothetical protein